MASTSSRSVLNLARRPPQSSLHVVSRSLASSSRFAAARHDDGAGSSTVDLGARSAGRHAAKDEQGNAIGREPGPVFAEWLESEGQKFKEPVPHQTNWLGGSVPFPLNPSFKPPPPLSDRLRTRIFDEWFKNPKQNNPRTLSIRHGISIKRVEAIIRLKTHEHQWVKAGKPLQTAFADAFESATGVYRGVAPHNLEKVPEQGESTRSDAAAADYDADWEQLPEQEISRVYWESIDEGEAATPVVPAKLAEVAEKRLALNKSHPPPTSIHKAKRTTFIDVGDKFAHTNAHVKKSDSSYKGPLWAPTFSSV